MQDKIINNIVTALSIKLVDPEQGEQAGIETTSTEAHDAYLRGWERYRQGAPEDLGKAAAFFEQAINIDPDYAQPRAALAAVYWDIYSKGWWEKSLAIPFYDVPRVTELSRKALRSSQQNPTALTYQVASETSALQAQTPRRALDEAQRAIELDPNSPAGHLALGNALIKAKKPQEAEQAILKAMRLNPHFPPDYRVRLALARFHLGKYRAAVESLEKAVAANPDDSWAFVYLAAAYGQLQLADKAQGALQRADSLRAGAGWGPITIVTTSHPYFRWVGKKDALKDGLRVAGATTGGEWLALVSENDGTIEVEGATSVDAVEAKQLYDRGAFFVNPHYAWISRYIPGSVGLEWWQEGWMFNEVSLRRLAAGREIVVYSTDDRDRRRVANPTALAVSRGIENVYFLVGGTDAWEAAGYPIKSGR